MEDFKFGDKILDLVSKKEGVIYRADDKNVLADTAGGVYGFDGENVAHNHTISDRQIRPLYEMDIEGAIERQIFSMKRNLEYMRSVKDEHNYEEYNRILLSNHKNCIGQID